MYIMGMARPKGTKNGEGRGRELADSTSIAIRLQRPQSVEDIANLLTNGIRCTYCQIDMTFEAMMNVHAEHMVSYNTGGTNSADNLVSACAKCNAQKSDELSALQFAFIKSAERSDPEKHLASVKASIAAQVTTPINFSIGRVAWSAWRYLTFEMTSNEERKDVTVQMILEQIVKSETMPLAA